MRSTLRAVSEVWPLVGRDAELEAFDAALDDPGCRGFLVVGPPGAGRTRLAEECLVRAQARGLAVVSAGGSEMARSLPLGAFAHLFRSEPASAPVATDLPPLDFTAVELFTHARQVLAERSGGRRLVGLLDDLDLLDSVSMNLVAQLVEVGAVFLVATLRANAPVPDLADRLWTAGRAVRADIGELDTAAVRSLLAAVLGGPVTAVTVTTFATVSRGNVQYLQELVRSAVRDGSLTRTDGVWYLATPPATGRRLHELVDARLADVDPVQREALEHLALCAPLELAILLELAPQAALEDLEAAGLVTVERDGRRRRAVLTHPLHAQVLRDRIPPERARHILRSHIDRLRGLGARRRGDVVRLATWELAASGVADPVLLVRAARLSRAELGMDELERLTRAALAAGPTGELRAEAHRLLGEALLHLDRPDEAELNLAEAARVFAETPGRQLRRTTVLRAVNKAFAIGRPAEALQDIADARALLGPEDQDELAGTAALILTIGGRPRAALETIEAAPGGLARIPGPLGAQARATALAASGRALAALPFAAADVELGGTASGDPDPDGMPWPHVTLRWFALSDIRYEAGQFAAALVDARRGLDGIGGADMRVAEAIGNYHLGRYHLAAGRPRTALRYLGETVATALANNMSLHLQQSSATSAVAHVLLGERGEARRCLDQALEAGARTERGLFARSAAWVRAGEGDIDGAVAVLVASAELDAADGDVAAATAALHDVVRLGRAGQVATRLAALTTGTDSPLVLARSRHAAAAAAADAGALEQVAQRFEEMGAVLYAAEAAVAAAEAFRDLDKARRAARMAAHAQALLATCEGARSPATAGRASGAQLSDREHEIARMAAAGVTSKEIAATLVLSVRTVNNHLQKVYRKLGISTRAELAGALARLMPGTTGPDGAGRAV